MKKFVYKIKRLEKSHETKKFVDTGIAFENIKDAQLFLSNYSLYSLTYTLAQEKQDTKLKSYATYDEFAKDNPQMEITRLKEELANLFVEFPFTVFIENQTDGTVKLTKIIPIKQLMVLFCITMEDDVCFRISSDEHIKIKKYEYNEFLSCVSKATTKYNEISRNLRMLEDYVPLDKYDDNQNLEKFEEEYSQME